MTKTYAIADLHGRFDLLFEAYERLAALEPGLIVHLGDYVDRGPDSAGVIRFLMSDAVIPQGFTRLVLKGNHEQIMVETIRNHLQPAWWMANGGNKTLMSYGHPRVRIRYNDCWPYNPDVVPPEHVDFLAKLPRLYCDRHRVYVHAGLDESLTLPEQKDDVLFWMIHRKDHPGGYRGQHVVHGHEQHAKGPQLYAERTNLDVCAYATDRLVIGVFDDDLPGGPVEVLEVKA
jgi:serine/threonine protein phosphatase 1